MPPDFNGIKKSGLGEWSDGQGANDTKIAEHVPIAEAKNVVWLDVTVDAAHVV